MSNFQIPSHIQEYLHSAEDFAQQVQGKKLGTSYSTTSSQELHLAEKNPPHQIARPIVYHTPFVHQNYSPFTYSITRSFLNWLFPSYHHVHHYHHTTSTPQAPLNPVNYSTSSPPIKGNGKGTKIIFSVVALALAALIAYSTGRDIAILGEASLDEKQLQRDKKYTDAFLSSSHLPIYLQHQFKDAFDIQQSIFDAYKQQAYQNILVKGVTFTGLAMGSLAYLFKQSSTFTTIGTAMTIAGGFAWAIKTGLDHTQQYTEKLSHQLYQTIFNIKKNIEIDY